MNINELTELMMNAKLDSLPPIPIIAQKILALKVGTDEGEEELFKLIEKDPALMAKIIGLSNSPLFARGRKIFTLYDAKAVLGSKRVKMTALGCAMISSMSKKPSGLLDIDKLWKHSLAIAMIMDTLLRYMPKERRPADDEVYLAGLLHDFGFLVLNYLEPQRCDQLYARMQAEPSRAVEEIEAEMQAMSHSELGAELAYHWSLPENIIEVLRYHHTPWKCTNAAQQSLVILAHWAEKALPTFDTGEAVSLNVDAEAWQALGIDPQSADEIMDKIKMCSDQVAEIGV